MITYSIQKPCSFQTLKKKVENSPKYGENEKVKSISTDRRIAPAMHQNAWNDYMQQTRRKIAERQHVYMVKTTECNENRTTLTLNHENHSLSRIGTKKKPPVNASAGRLGSSPHGNAK